MNNSQKGFILLVLLVIIALLVIGGSVYIYEKNKKAIPVPLTKTCEKTGHFSLVHIPYGWNSSTFCLRDTAIFTEATSSDYTMESDAPAEEYHSNLVLVKGARFEVSADPGYPYAGCNLPPVSNVLRKPITEKKSINVDGYAGIFAHVQEPVNPPSPAIDYYYVRIPVSGAPCQMIDFVSVVSTTTDNEIKFQKFLDGLKFVRDSSASNSLPVQSASSVQ